MSYTDTTGTTAAAIKDEAGTAPKYEMTHGKAVAILLIGTACLAFSAIWVKGANFEPATSVVLRCWLPIIIFLPSPGASTRRRADSTRPASSGRPSPV